MIVDVTKNGIFRRVFPGIILGNATKVSMNKTFGLRAVHGLYYST